MYDIVAIAKGMIILSNYHNCESFGDDLEELGNTFYDYVPDLNIAGHHPQAITQPGMVEWERYVYLIFRVNYELISC